MLQINKMSSWPSLQSFQFKVQKSIEKKETNKKKTDKQSKKKQGI